MTYYQYFLSSKGDRDEIFDRTLNYLNQQPAKILEIGVARATDTQARRSDGWSSVHFGRYVSLHGGHLDLVDVSEQSLINCRSLVDSITPEFSYSTHCLDGRAFLDKTTNHYDIILLDGSDDPQEMLNCFELANNKSDYILCDDFHAKGSLLREAYKDHLTFTWPHNPHEMALYRTRNPFPYEKIYLPDWKD